MKNTKTLEALVGGFVILGIIGLMFLAYKVSSVNSVGRDGMYHLQADFASASGLKTNASVTLAGVKIGQVDSISVNTKNYKAHVTLSIDKKFSELPIDSNVSILTQGLLGEKYLGVDVGISDEYLVDGDSFAYTKSSMVLEKLINQFINSSMKDK